MLNEAKRKRPAPKKEAKPSLKRAKAGTDEFGLSVQQRAFADFFLVDQNATAAYKLAGYLPKDDNVAAAAASRLLRVAKVGAYVNSRLKVVRDHLQITQERVLTEVARMAYFDPAKCYDAKGKLLALHLMDEDTRRAISSVEFDDKGHVTKVRASDKNSAAEKLMRYLRLFKDAEIQPAGPVIHNNGGTVTVVSSEDAYRKMLAG